MEMNHAISGDFSYQAMTVDSERFREHSIVYDICAACLAIKEAGKEGKPTVGICSCSLREQPLWKFRQCLHTTGFNRAGSSLIITVYMAVSSPSRTPPMATFPSSPSPAPVGRLSAVSITRAVEVPAAPQQSLSGLD